MEIQARYDPDSGMILFNVPGPHFALALKDALAGLISMTPPLQPPDKPLLVIAGQIPDFGGRQNGS